MMSVTVRYRGYMEGKVKRLPKELGAALRRAVEAWHHGRDPAFSGMDRGFLRYHFSGQAFHRYPDAYKPRGVKYQERKKRKYGHNDPLVWTGLTKLEVTRNLRVVVSKNSARGVMHGSNRALNFRGRGKHSLREELLALNAHEIEKLRRGHEQIVWDVLKSEEPVVTKRL